MNLVEKLSAIQVELNAPKNQYNSFGKYNYRSCEDILEGLKPLLKKYKVALTITDKVELVSSAYAGNVENRYYIVATATLYDCESEQVISNSAYAREEQEKKGMDSAQVSGATSSYARKYALNGLFCIDDNKDPDTDSYKVESDNKANFQKKKAVEAETPKPSVSDVLPISQDNLALLSKQDEKVIKFIYSKFNVDNLNQLTDDEAIGIINGMKKKGTLK